MSAALRKRINATAAPDPTLSQKYMRGEVGLMDDRVSHHDNPSGASLRHRSLATSSVSSRRAGFL